MEINILNKYFILARTQVELRGIVTAPTEKAAKARIRDSWYIYDGENNSLASGSSDPDIKPPIVSEVNSRIRIMHVKDVTSDDVIRFVYCPDCGAGPGNKCSRLSRLTKRMDAYHMARKNKFEEDMKFYTKHTEVEGW